MNKEYLEFIQFYISSMPKKVGKLKFVRNYGSNEFILVFHDTPWNWGARLSIASVIEDLAKRRMIDLVGEDGAMFPNEIDMSVVSDFPLQDIRKAVMLHYLKEELKITAPEYVYSVFEMEYSRKPFILCGIEDERLYQRAHDVWKSGDMIEFYHLDIKRAEVITRNILVQCRERGVETAGIVCCGNLPQFICGCLGSSAVSHGLFEPKFSKSADKRKKYNDNVDGVLMPIEKLLMGDGEQEKSNEILSYDEGSD